MCVVVQVQRHFQVSKLPLIQYPIARQASTFTAVRRRTPEGAGANDMFAYYATYLCVCAACNELCCRLRQATLDSTDGVLAPPLYPARKFLPSGTVLSDFLPCALGKPAPRQAVRARPGRRQWRSEPWGLAPQSSRPSLADRENTKTAPRPKRQIDGN